MTEIENESCVEEAMRSHERVVIFCAFTLCGNMEDARDAAQHAFIKLAHAPCPSIKHTRAWVIRACQNYTKNLLRSRERTAGLTEEKWASLVDDFADSGYDALKRKERLTRLFQLVETLTPKQREVLLLIYGAGLPRDEVAAAMAITLGAVYKLQYDALAALRKKWEQEESK